MTKKNIHIRVKNNYRHVTETGRLMVKPGIYERNSPLLHGLGSHLIEIGDAEIVEPSPEAIAAAQSLKKAVAAKEKASKTVAAVLDEVIEE